MGTLGRLQYVDETGGGAGSGVLLCGSSEPVGPEENVPTTPHAPSLAAEAGAVASDCLVSYGSSKSKMGRSIKKLRGILRLR